MTRLDLFKDAKFAVEVGTLQGDFAKEITDKYQGIYLNCVDYWPDKFKPFREKFMLRMKPEHERGIKINTFDFYITTKVNELNGVRQEWKLLETDSATAAQWFLTESQIKPDLVYIDAAHDYLSVLEDIEAWWPVVKQGGILAGHDYEEKPDDGFWGPIEVKPAADAWAKKHGLKVNKTDEHDAPSWWVVKP